MDIKVVILCGGRGTRLYEETEFRPKPLVEIGGQPLLWHIMKGFAHHGMNDFVLCLGYKGNLIKEYFLNYDAFNSDLTISTGNDRGIRFHDDVVDDFRVTLANTGLDTMTGARVRRVHRFIDTELFVVTYGDGLCDVPLDRLVEFHRSHGRIATVTAIRPHSRFGELNLDTSGGVTAFREKPQLGDYVSGGFFVFDRRVFDYLSPASDVVLEGEPMRRLVAERELVGYRHDGFFFSIDTYRDYLHVQKMWDSGNRPWAYWAAGETTKEARNG